MAENSQDAESAKSRASWVLFILFGLCVAGSLLLIAGVPLSNWLGETVGSVFNPPVPHILSQEFQRAKTQTQGGSRDLVPSPPAGSASTGR